MAGFPVSRPVLRILSRRLASVPPPDGLASHEEPDPYVFSCLATSSQSTLVACTALTIVWLTFSSDRPCRLDTDRQSRDEFRSHWVLSTATTKQKTGNWKMA